MYLLRLMFIIYIHSVLLQFKPTYGFGRIPDLYSDSDGVTLLNAQSFMPIVYHQNKNITYMVQFYNTYCGHCQIFAPTYKELAKRVKNWSNTFRLAGVDCSKDENVLTCSDNKIPGYPTIYLYPPNPNAERSADDPIDVGKLGIEWTIEGFEETVINFMQNLTQTNREYPTVINALPIVHVTQPNLFKRVHQASREGSVQDLMFIVEGDESYLGRKLIMEYSNLTTKIELRRISLSNDLLLKSLMKEKDYIKLSRDQPILLKVDRIGETDQDSNVLVKGEYNITLPTKEQYQRNEYIFNRFKKFLNELYSIEIRENIGDHNEYPPNEAADTSGQNQSQYMIHGHPVKPYTVSSVDLMKSVAYMLTHEVPIRGTLSPEEFKTVRNLLTIINKFLPLYVWDSEMAHFVSSFRTRLDESRSTYETRGITGREMLDEIKLSGGDEISHKYRRESWVSCFNSDKNQKGYTCSLWLLFHTMTVGEFFKSAPINKQTKLVLTTMRDYITTFLGCTVCANNFKKETENLEVSLTSRNSSVLWLWKTHNSVNRRLNLEKGSGKKHELEVLFPSPQNCRKCIVRPLESDYVWNASNVFEYLIEIYAPDQVVKQSEMSLSSPIAVDEWSISTSDVSLCLVFYVSSIMIVSLVCLALNPRWKHMIRQK